MKKLLYILILMLLLSVNSYAVSDYKYNRLVDEYNELIEEITTLEKKYNKLARKSNNQIDKLGEISQELRDTKKNLKVEKANACGYLRIVDVDSKRNFPTISGIKEHGDYVNLDALDKVFNDSLSGESKVIGMLFDVMHAIRQVENKINNEYIEISSLAAVNEQYLGCLWTEENVYGSEEKKRYGNSKKEEFSSLLEAVSDAKRELTKRLNGYSYKINEELNQPLDSSK